MSHIQRAACSSRAAVWLALACWLLSHSQCRWVFWHFSKGPEVLLEKSSTTQFVIRNS